MNDSHHYAALGQVVEAVFSNGTNASWVEGWIEHLQEKCSLRYQSVLIGWLENIAQAMRAVELIPLPGSESIEEGKQ